MVRNRGADIAIYLARHGKKVSVDRVPSGGREVEDVLNQHALDNFGRAYRHGRLRAFTSSGKGIPRCHQVARPEDVRQFRISIMNVRQSRIRRSIA
ncbi:hypothetical protein EMEDMD4_1080096 [Sinorhizobium medicae]|uniref:Uncharacterized protein n=1 Tax=Sinorhizobium medicae TaxID=110321 RepID=A0A508WPT0_9HYPH|nr:hypothetical protein EMEDMD4_1080096 [Sinorhizobium medicae]